MYDRSVASEQHPKPLISSWLWRRPTHVFECLWITNHKCLLSNSNSPDVQLHQAAFVTDSLQSV